MTKQVSIIIFSAFLLVALLPELSHAQTAAGQFVPLVPDFPQIAVNSYSLPNLLNAFYAVAVGIAGLLAVIMVSIGGFKYMMSESVFSKSDAKGQITDALIGLGIVLGAVLLLEVINPELTNLDILRNAPPAAAIYSERGVYESLQNAYPSVEDESLHAQIFEGPECLPEGSQTCHCPSILNGGVLISKRGESPCRYQRGEK